VKLRVEGPEKRFVSCTGMVRWNGEGESEYGSSGRGRRTESRGTSDGGEEVRESKTESTGIG
jgi:hypothetical protein